MAVLWGGVALSCLPSSLRGPEPLPSPQPPVPKESTTASTRTQDGLRLEDVKDQLNSRQIEKIQRAAQKLREQQASADHERKGANKTKCIIRTSSVAKKEGSCIYMGGFCRLPGGHGIYYDQVNSMWV